MGNEVGNQWENAGRLHLPCTGFSGAVSPGNGSLAVAENTHDTVPTPPALPRGRNCPTRPVRLIEGITLKTALLIAYYWPPSGGAGVYRWLKMSRYLSGFGWRLIVFTPANAERPVHDDSLLSDVSPEHEVLSIDTWEPYALYKRLTGRSAGEAVYSGMMSEKGPASPMQRLSIWLRGNLFIPDPRRFWIGPGVRYLRRELPGREVHAVISTGPPHSTHLMAQRVAEEFRLPWIADFRDPWTGIDYFPDLKLTRFAERWHRSLERQVLTGATRVVTVTPTWAKELAELSGRPVDLVRNGFDHAEFAGEVPAAEARYTISYFGSMGSDRDPLTLWDTLARLRDAHVEWVDDVRIELYGPIDHAVLRSVKKRGLERQVSIMNYLPHAQAVQRMRVCRMLLLCVNRRPSSAGHVPGKLYEYLAAQRPILLIGPGDGDAAALVRELSAGWVADFDDTETVEQALRALHAGDEDNSVSGTSDGAKRPDEYSRRSAAECYAGILDRMTSEQEMLRRSDDAGASNRG